MRYRVLIVDDKREVRASLRSLISCANEWTVCAEAADGVEAVEKANALLPDLILLDISMPRLNGIEAARIIRVQVPDARVLILSQNEPGILAKEAAAATAHGFLSKTHAGDHLLTLMNKIIAA